MKAVQCPEVVVMKRSVVADFDGHTHLCRATLFFQVWPLFCGRWWQQSWEALPESQWRLGVAVVYHRQMSPSKHRGQMLLLGPLKKQGK